MRPLTLASAIVLLTLLALQQSAGATKPFHPAYDFLSISNSATGAHGDVLQRITSSPGDNMISKAVIQLPAEWDIRQATVEAIVGSGQLILDVNCDSTPQTYPLTIYELGTLTGDAPDVETNWEIRGYFFQNFLAPVKQSGSDQTVELILFPGFVSPQICPPMDLTLTFQGISSDNPLTTGTDESGDIVLANPAADGVYTWSVDLHSSPLKVPPDHLVNRCDQVGIGSGVVTDTDADGIADSCDNCPSLANADQRDSDLDGVGDLCDPDDDGDGVPDASDLCPLTGPAGSPDPVDANGCSAVQVDQDLDGLCDPGTTSSFCTGTDNCPTTNNPGQEDWNSNGIGDLCEDSDGDLILDALDNCPGVANLFQEDGDADGLGDACDPCPSDPDCDDDGLLDDVDPCIQNPDCDGDGWTDYSEVTFIGTDPLDDCPDGPSDAAFPVDFDNDTFITSSDLSAVAAVIGQAVPPAPARTDIDPNPPDQAITSGDLSQVAARIGQGCVP